MHDPKACKMVYRSLHNLMLIYSTPLLVLSLSSSSESDKGKYPNPLYSFAALVAIFISGLTFVFLTPDFSCKVFDSTISK
mgnify:CR=1 FL=1